MVSMIQKNIFRDVRENAFAFLAIICVCSLGIALFAGMNLYVSTVENELNAYYEKSNLADYWIYKTEITEAEYDKVKSLEYITQANKRKMLEVSTLGNVDATLRIHGVDGQMTVNMPELLSGEPLSESDNKELLLDSRFAEANGIEQGEYISFIMGGQLEDWIVKGIIRNVEYVHYAPSGLTIPNYQKYGFAYGNAAALSGVPYIELTLTANESVSTEQLTTQLRETLGGTTIIGRHHQTSYRTVSDDLDGNRKMGMMFPIVFFLTAALVTWITVGRMMENQRQHLGTLRSIGFSKRNIIRRYTLYGILITIPSMILGWIIARFLIADTLYKIGTTYYTIEAKGVSAVSPHFFLAAACVALVTCGATFLSCKKSLINTPAALMRPKPPAQGHNILLEKIPIFWKNLSFSGKIVARNLFRNKSRMLMGLVGIIGSMALIVCGFGITDSINSLLDKTFSETINYNAEAKLKGFLTADEVAEICDLVEAEDYDVAMTFSVTIYSSDGGTQTPYLVVLDDVQNSLLFQDVEGNAVFLPDKGALITPRMSKALKLSIGDTIEVENTDGTTLHIEVAGIVDFPVGNEIYMSKAAFNEVTDTPFAIRIIFLRGQSLKLAALQGDPRITVVETKDEMASNMDVVLKLMQSIQMMLVVFSGLLQHDFLRGWTQLKPNAVSGAFPLKR